MPNNAVGHKAGRRWGGKWDSSLDVPGVGGAASGSASAEDGLAHRQAIVVRESERIEREACAPPARHEVACQRRPGSSCVAPWRATAPSPSRTARPTPPFGPSGCKNGGKNGVRARLFGSTFAKCRRFSRRATAWRVSRSPTARSFDPRQALTSAARRRRRSRERARPGRMPDVRSPGRHRRASRHSGSSSLGRPQLRAGGSLDLALSFSTCAISSSNVAHPCRYRQSISKVRSVGLPPVQRWISRQAMIAQ